MIIGVRPETKRFETRIALTPYHVQQLVEKGNQVLVASKSGLKSGFSNEAYQQAGATIVSNNEDVYAADLLVGVKEPQDWEFGCFRPGQRLASYFHIGGDPALVDKLEAAGISCVAYELIQTEDRQLPVLAPMSIIAGALAVVIGSDLLRSANGGMGVSLAPICGQEGGEVLVYGCGNAGAAAIRQALNMNATVTAIDRNPAVLARMNEQFARGNSANFLTLLNDGSPKSIASENESLKHAHLVVGAVLIPGLPAPKVLSAAQVGTMRPGSVIVDVAIDEGGCIEGEKIAVTGRDFVSRMAGNGGDVIHFAQPNMPSQWGSTASVALANSFFPYLEALVSGFDEAVVNNAAIRSALIVQNGQRTEVTRALLARHH